MKTLLLRSAFFCLVLLITNLFFSNTVTGQSCSSNDIGFNTHTATDALTICTGTAGTTLDGGDPAGSETYVWEVSATNVAGPFSTVSPDPGSVQNWTISSTYYNTAGTYYFRRVVSGNSSGCDGNSDVVALAVKFSPLVTNSGGTPSSCANDGFIVLYGSGGVTPYTYSIDGTTYQAGNTFTNLAAGTYTGYVKDAIGCIGTKPNIVLTAAAPISVTSHSNAASSCQSDGSIQLFRTGGVGSYTYSLDDITYQVSNTFTGLAGGTYTGWVKDAYGCKGSLTGIVVTTAPAVTVTAAKSNTTACGNTGFIQLYPAGGVPGYTYSLDDITYQAGSSFSGLAAGNYTCWAKDSKGCKSSVGITVGTDPGSPITVTGYPHSTSSCTNNGYIQLFRSGGIGPYSYSIDDITYQLSNTLTGLAAGTYTAWVKDANGCKGSRAGIVVTQSAVVTVTQTHINTSTCVNDGSITLTAGYGIAPYTYSLDDITYQAGATFTGVGAGNYTGWAKDVNGCKASVNLAITQNPIVVTAYAGNASSCGGTNGSIQLFRTGGVGPYTYSIDGATYQSSNAFTNLTPGTYTGYVKDAGGCIGTLTINVGPQNSTISLTSGAGTNAQTACKNTAISNITYAIGGGGTGASITSGSLPAGVTGSYSAGVFTISGTATAAGVYNYTITPTGTCTPNTASGTITVNAAPTATFTKTMASSCGGGNDGTITVTASGGTGSYAYSWTGAGGYTASTAAVTSLAVGDYTVVVSDAGLCSTTIPAITIWQAQTPIVTNNGGTSASCSATGFIILYGSYGVPPFTYSIDGTNYQTSNTFNNLSPATYTGYVKDLKGCIATKSIVIGSTAPIIVTDYARNATSCGTNNGLIQLFLTGGVNPYSYSLDGTTYQASPVFSGLAPGTYRGYVKDAMNCVGTLSNINVGPSCPSPFAAKHNNANTSKTIGNNIFSVEAYPNPSATEFTLVLTGDSKEKVAISVTDMMGRKVYESNASGKNQYKFGNDFKPGIYIAEIIQGDNKQSIRLTKE